MCLATENNRISSDSIRNLSRASMLLLLPLVASLGACKSEATLQEEVIRPVKVAVIEPAHGERLLNILRCRTTED